jgi:hypothetical protein
VGLELDVAGPYVRLAVAVAAQIVVFEPKQKTAFLTTIDDFIPCFNGNPITKTKILGSEVRSCLAAELLGSGTAKVAVRSSG